MAERRANLSFRGMLADIALKLSAPEQRALGYIYLDHENLKSEDIETDNLHVMDRITKKAMILNCEKDLVQLQKSLHSIGREDLTTIVREYIEKSTLPPEIPRERFPITPQTGTREDRSDISNSAFTGVVAGRKMTAPGIANGKKRRRVETEEERELEEAATGMMVCDSTSDSSDEADGDGNDEITAKDKEFMQMARSCAMNSRDPQTKVGAILVDCNGKVLGKGWNRMPVDCEDRFSWECGNDVAFKDGKHLYVVYAVRAAIFDAYKKKEDLQDSILYTTLYPSNVCAQCIREAGIKEVVYISDKFHHTKFMIASRRIMDGIKCRIYNDRGCDMSSASAISMEPVSSNTD